MTLIIRHWAHFIDFSPFDYAAIFLPFRHAIIATPLRFHYFDIIIDIDSIISFDYSFSLSFYFRFHIAIRIDFDFIIDYFIFAFSLFRHISLIDAAFSFRRYFHFRIIS